MPAVFPQDVAVCSENPLDNLYISVDGEVSPCVYLYPPVSSPFTRIYCDTEHPTPHVSFGNIFNEPFESIWNRKEYQEFRDAFIFRQKRWEEAYVSLLEMRRPKIHLCPHPPPPAEPVIRCSGSENQTNCMKTKKGREGLTRMDNLWRMVL